MNVELTIESVGKGALSMSVPESELQETIATLVQLPDVTWIGVKK